MDKFCADILKFIRDNGLIVRGDRVLTGLSGGADSVSLLLLLNDLKRLLGIELAAVHVNHGLRGAEAVRDEEFCMKLCERLGVKHSSVSVDVPAFVRETGMTEEEAGRLLRYEALNKKGEELLGAGFKIAVAHHADDQAETILFNLLRGTGPMGMGGMQPKRGNIIRPMLMTGKTDILKWLEQRGENYVTDSTNLLNDHTRNYLRNTVMPGLRENVNEKAAEHIAAAGRKIYAADLYVRDEASEYIRRINAENLKENEKPGKIRLGKGELKEKPQIFRIYAIIEALRLLEVPLKDWGERHFKDIDKLLFSGNGAHTDLPGTVSADNLKKETWLIINKGVIAG